MICLVPIVGLSVCVTILVGPVIGLFASVFGWFVIFANNQYYLVFLFLDYKYSVFLYMLVMPVLFLICLLLFLLIL